MLFWSALIEMCHDSSRVPCFGHKQLHTLIKRSYQLIIDAAINLSYALFNKFASIFMPSINYYFKSRPMLITNQY